MCSEQATVTAAVCELQDRELAAALRTIFAGQGWALIRPNYPGQTDLAILRRVLEREAQRVAVRGASPVTFFASEFERCR